MNALVEEKIAESIVETTPPERGALFLDEHVPGWYNQIDLDKFNIRMADVCVCGQVFADKAETVDPAFGYEYFRQTYGTEKVWDLGFCAAYAGSDEEGANEQWSRLQEQWVEIIRERQSTTTEGNNA